nr:hypothetical protein [Mesorhizobium sp.]
METIDTPGQRFVPVDEILARAPEKTRKARQPLAIPVTIRPNKHLAGLTSAVHTHVVPDALYGIEYVIDNEKRYRFFALECENRSPKRRTTARLSSLALKRAAYEAVMQQRGYREVYGVPSLAMQIIGSESSLVSDIRLLEKHALGSGFG